MTGTASPKKKGCTEVDARVITKASHVTCMLEFSRRYGLACKTKLLIGVLCKITSGKLPSSHLRINVHARFDLGGDIFKFFKVDLQSYSFAPGPVLISNFIHSPVALPHINITSKSSRREVGVNFILTTMNDEI